jgi:hypothetical protein
MPFFIEIYSSRYIGWQKVGDRSAYSIPIFRKLKTSALKAFRLWRNHENMLARGIYHQMMTTVFKALAVGVQQVQGFDLVDTSSSEGAGFEEGTGLELLMGAIWMDSRT